MRYSFGPGIIARLLWLLLAFSSALTPEVRGQVSGGVYASSNSQSSVAHQLSGVVVNSATGAPIPYALVQVGQHAKMADQNGEFHFEDLPYAEAVVNAHKPGFFEDWELTNGQGRFSSVKFGEQPVNLVIRLVPEAVVSGHIENAEGEPVEGIPVVLRFTQVVNGRRMWQAENGHSTDEDGNFRISNLKPGTYFMEAGPGVRGRAIGFQAGNEKLEVYPVQYYPGVAERTAATALRLNPGDHPEVNFRLGRVPGYRLAGMVAGAPNSGNLMLTDAEGNPVPLPLRYDPRTSRFDAYPVPAGVYRVRFNGQDEDGKQLFADATLEVAKNLSEIRIVAQRTVDVPLEVVNEHARSDQSPPSVLVRSGPPHGGHPQLHLTSRQAPYQQYWATAVTQGGEEAFRGLPPGIYDLDYDSYGNDYVASVTSGGVDLLREPLVLSASASPQTVQVVMRDDSASISGSVKLPEGERGANVLLLTDDGEQHPRAVPVDSTGKFQAAGLAPGSYEVVALDRIDGIEYRNRQAIGNYLGQAAHVTLSPEQQAQVTVDMVRIQQ